MHQMMILVESFPSFLLTYFISSFLFLNVVAHFGTGIGEMSMLIK